MRSWYSGTIHPGRKWMDRKQAGCFPLPTQSFRVHSLFSVAAVSVAVDVEHKFVIGRFDVRCHSFFNIRVKAIPDRKSLWVSIGSKMLNERPPHQDCAFFV